MPVVSLRFVHNFSNFRPFKWEVNNARECRTLDKGLLPNPDYERASRILTENIAAATLRGWQSPLYGRIFYDTFHSSKRARPSISQIRGVRDANQHSFMLCRVHQSDENVSFYPGLSGHFNAAYEKLLCNLKRLVISVMFT